MHEPTNERHLFIHEVIFYLYGGANESNSYIVDEIEHILDSKLQYEILRFDMVVKKINSQRPNSRAGVTAARFIFAALGLQDQIHWQVDY